MNEPQDTLRRLLQSGTDSTPALNGLLHDYAKYHAVLVVVGGAFVAGFLVLSAFSWRRFRRAPKPGGRRWTFERRTFLFFATASLVLGGMLALVVAANLSNALAPRHGFAAAVDTIGTPGRGTPMAQLHEAFTTWLRSGGSQRPALVQSRIDDRLAWQRPKAIICAVLLAVLAVLGARIWRRLVRTSRARRPTGRDRALLAAGVGTGLACLLLVVMVVANTQACLAPLTMTLLFG
ncbi:MAG TPA: hypothetical protein VH479_14785 [Acidimicrobiales bacterium]